MTHLNFTQMLRICPTGHLIGIKRKPCEVSQIPNGTSLNSDIESTLWERKETLY